MTLARYMIVLSLCGISALMSPRIEAQSFDCKKASTPVERWIRGDKRVADMDIELAQTFQEALSRDPTKRSALISGERQWLALRERQCSAYLPDSGTLDDCLADLYGRRIADIREGRAINAATQPVLGTPKDVCPTIVQRYRPLAHSHPGESPFNVLAGSKTSGITLPPALSGAQPMQTESDLVAWAAKQNPPISISDGLVKVLQDFLGGPWATTLEKAPIEEFYSLSRTEGTANCYEGLFFSVSHGVASRVEGPPNTEADGCAGVGGFFASMDNEPLFVQYRGELASMDLEVDVSTWNVDRFVGNCSVVLSYDPLFNDTTLNDWPRLNDWPSCKGDDCDGLHKAAFRLAEGAHRDPVLLERDSVARLTPAERQQYDAAKQVAVAATGADAIAASITDSSALVDIVPLHVPYVDHGVVYVVSLGHFTIGARPPFADWSVTFGTLDDGKLVQKAGFAVGMWKGDLISASEPAGGNPNCTDPQRRLGECH